MLWESKILMWRYDKMNDLDKFKTELRVLLKKYSASICATAGNGYMSMWITSNVGNIDIDGDCEIHKSHVVALHHRSNKLLVVQK